MAQEPLEVHKVTFEVYKVTIENTNKLRDQKQALDTLYTTITTFVLGAAAYTASHSKFNSWFPVIVTIIISLVGLAFTLHWRQTSDDLTDVLRIRYALLKQLETNQELASNGAQMYLREDELFAKSPRKGTQLRIQRLQTIFMTIFMVIPLLLILATILSGTTWFNHFFQPLN